MVGTPQFLSPEQAVGGEVDHRADLYSAGIIAWLLATGAHPFPTQDPRTLLRAHAYDPVLLPTSEPSLEEHPLSSRSDRSRDGEDPAARAQCAAELLDIRGGAHFRTGRAVAGHSPRASHRAPHAPRRPARATDEACSRRRGARPRARGDGGGALLGGDFVDAARAAHRVRRLADAEDRITALREARGAGDPEVLYLSGLLDSAHAERGAAQRCRTRHRLVARRGRREPRRARGPRPRGAPPRCDRRRLAARALGDSRAIAAPPPLRGLAQAEPAVPEPSGALARVMRDLDSRCGAGDLARRAIRDIETAAR